MTAPVAALDGVTVRYGARTALDDVTLEVAAGERVAVLGASGAGKSTLVGVLAGLVEPTAGTVRLLGQDVAGLRGPRLRAVRARVGLVHQQLGLVGPLRVVHNVNAGRLGRWPAWKALASLVRPLEVERAAAALARLGLADRLHDRTDTLSGGQRQRVALARVLVQEPDLVLADEPVSALDVVLAEDVAELLTTVVATEGRALVVSLHDVVLALRWCDRVVGLADGRVVLDAPAAALGEGDLAGLYGPRQR